MDAAGSPNLVGAPGGKKHLVLHRRVFADEYPGFAADAGRCAVRRAKPQARQLTAPHREKRAGADSPPFGRLAYRTRPAMRGAMTTLLLTLSDAAAELQISADSVRRLVATGKIPVV